MTGPLERHSFLKHLPFQGENHNAILKRHASAQQTVKQEEDEEGQDEEDSEENEDEEEMEAEEENEEKE